MKEIDDMEKRADYFFEQIDKHNVDRMYLIGALSCYIEKEITDKIIKNWLERNDKH